MAPQGRKGPGEVVGVWGVNGVDLGINLSLMSGMEQSGDDVTECHTVQKSEACRLQTKSSLRPNQSDYGLYIQPNRSAQ